MPKITKVMRYKIIKPAQQDISWKMLGKILRTLQIETYTIQNKTSQLAWEYFNFSEEYKLKTGSYPKLKNNPILGVGKSGKKHNSSLQNYCNTCLTNDTKSYSTNILQSIKRVTDKFSPSKKKEAFINQLRNAEVRTPQYKNNSPIDVVKDSISIIKDSKQYIVDLKLLNNSFKKELELPSSQISVVVDKGKNYSRVILDKILSGEYSISASQILEKDNDWYVNICYQFHSKNEVEGYNNVMGIDMGIVFPVYFAISDSDVRGNIIGGEIDSFRKQVMRRKRELQSQSKYCGNGRRGHGIKTRMKPVEVIGEKISNFQKTTNHKYSRYIIDNAIKNKCNVIQMEDLSGISNKNKFLKNWTYFELQQMITYKAEEKGIQVIKIDPQYTSQRCSECGHIESDNRDKSINQSKFECVMCGYKTNADYNASRNISTLNIDSIIEEKCKELGLKYKKNKDKDE